MIYFLRYEVGHLWVRLLLLRSEPSVAHLCHL